MTDETPKPPEDTPVNDETPKPEAEEPVKEDSSTASPEPKPTVTDEEKAAKIAAAKAKAAAKKAAEADAEPKPPWEEKPVPPERSDASDHPDVVALAGGVEGSVLAAGLFAGDLTITVPVAKIVEICSYLKTERGFSFLVDLTAVDWPEREEGRFDVVYWMHRFDDEFRLRLVTTVAEDQIIESMTGVWKVANWMEREVYDLYGIVFANHPSLERILMWEGFNGHPLRKDFPVEGIDTGAAIYPDVYPEGGGPVVKPEKKADKPEKGDKA